ncbi:IclR family transcriptional regulator [Amnibacterium kyonggiense]
MSDDGQRRQGVQSVEIAASVLDALAETRGAGTLGEVARRAGLHPAKAHRYLVSLTRTGLAAQDPRTGRYDLGPAARRIGLEALRRTDAESVAAAHALRLRDRTGHTVNLAVWSEAGPVIVRWDSGAHPMPFVLRVGSVVPLLDSALGMVFLAHLPRLETDPVLEQQQLRYETRPLSETDRELLTHEIRESGAALAPTNLIAGFAAHAAPVFDADGRVAMAIGLALPVRLLVTDSTLFVDELRSTAAAISGELGHRAGATVSGTSR